jgi:hypothetical protein
MQLKKYIVESAKAALNARLFVMEASGGAITVTPYLHSMIS